MKIDIKSKEVKDEYPKLMINPKTHDILFAIAEDNNQLEGFIISPGKDSPNDLGENTDEWVKSCFKDFPGIITLSND